ncbi:hypothetical protein E4099_00140 [Streptomyces palmae]|uniref:Uncharacterized protein n=1 Tax=Streptomyces palmae TaxID=1701085 RepID=A0A4Z0HED6_9ACTN|nr:hypothetical protein E4099_00140 [Streptomyces palmae]
MERAGRRPRSAVAASAVRRWGRQRRSGPRKCIGTPVRTPGCRRSTGPVFAPPRRRASRP